MKCPIGTKVVVSKEATSLYLQELSEGRCDVVYTVLHSFNDGMNSERLMLKSDRDSSPRWVGICSDFFEVVGPDRNNHMPSFLSF
jgi:hypothetical protein